MVSQERPGIPPQYFGAATSKINLDEKSLSDLRKWASNPKGNALFHGETRKGKTYTAISLMYFFEAKKNIPWSDQRFVEISDFYQQWLVNTHTSYENLEMLNKLKECKVLVLDDLGVRKPTDAFLDYLYCLINHRTNYPELITIYTTNLSSKELTESFGPRIISRIGNKLIIKFEKSLGKK